MIFSNAAHAFRFPQKPLPRHEPLQHYGCLIGEYYAGILSAFNKGERKDEALHQAKLVYLGNTIPDHATPVYWAGAVLMGDEEALVAETTNWWLWILPGIPLLFFLLFYQKTKGAL